MADLIWNTKRMLDVVRDGCDSSWKVEAIPAANRFETTRIIAYHPMFGKRGPHLVVSGMYIPRVKNQDFDPDNCVVDGFAVGDNNSDSSLSVPNQNNFLAPAYSKLQDYLKQVGLSNMFDHALEVPQEDDFKCN